MTTDQPMTETQRWIELMIPGADSGLALFTPKGHENRIGEFQSVSFWCDDVFATAKVLKSKGVQFEVEPKPGGSVIRQTAIFDPAGLAGLLYWYALYPIHEWIFAGMLRSIAARAERTTE